LHRGRYLHGGEGMYYAIRSQLPYQSPGLH
jgi:hypothetical protein